MQKSAIAYMEEFHILPQDLRTMRQAGALILPALPDIIGKYSDWARSKEALLNVFGGKEGVMRNAQLKHEHWASVFNANVNEEYIAFRHKLGQHHADIGLSVEQHFSIVTTFVHLFENAFEDLGLVSAELHKAFTKFVHLDLSIVLQAYSAAHDEMMRLQTEAILSMAAPVAQLWTGILFTPLVGIMDSKRAHDIMSTMLMKVATTHARIFVLDISGVAVLDTAVANHLIRIARATQLMGCQTIISGVSPTVAQTIVSLGLDVRDISTTSSMQDAIQLAFRIAGVRKLYKKKNQMQQGIARLA